MNATPAFRAVLSALLTVGILLGGAAMADAAPKVKVNGQFAYSGNTSQNIESKKGVHGYGVIKMHLDAQRRVDSLDLNWRCPRERFYRGVQGDSIEKGFGPVKLRGRGFRFTHRVKWYNASVGPQRTGSAKVKVIGQFFKRRGVIPRKWRNPVPKSWTKGPGVPKRFIPGSDESIGAGRLIITGKRCRVAVPFDLNRAERAEKESMSLLLASSPVGSADDAPGAFSRTGDMTVVRSSPRAALLPDGRVFVVGGRQTVADVYDPASGTFSALATPTTDRYAPAVAALPDGKVLIAGGEVEYEATASAEIYDPSNDSYTPIAPLPHPLIGAGAAPLPDGRVMLIGGQLAPLGAGTAASLIFDPASNTFSPGPSPRHRRTFGVVTALSDGRLIVIGDSAPPELFDPATGSFHAGEVSLVEAGFVPAVAALPDGTALILHAGNRMASIYDPDQDRLIPAAQMEEPRLNGMAITLPNEDVLIAGGWNGEADTRTAEVFSGGPYLGVSAEPLAKGLVGGRTVPGTIKVTNRSANPTQPLSPVTVGPAKSGVRVKGDGCGGTRLGPGESCALSVNFAPRRPGAGSFTVEATAVATRSFAVSAARITLKRPARPPRGKRPVLARVVCENGPCKLNTVRATLRSGRKSVRLRVRTRKVIRGEGRVALPIRAKVRGSGRVKIRIRAGIPGGPLISRQVTVRVRR